MNILHIPKNGGEGQFEKIVLWKNGSNFGYLCGAMGVASIYRPSGPEFKSAGTFMNNNVKKN